MATQTIMRVLAGPPGTGKTYRAARVALEILEGECPASSEDVAERYKDLVRSNRIFPVTFHPSYAYEDFVEGFRPVANDGELSYAVEDGPFLQAVKAAGGLVELGSDPVSDLSKWFKVGQWIQASSGPAYEVVSVDSGGVALRSVIKRKDSVTTESLKYADFWTIERLREHKYAPGDITMSGSDNEARRKIARKTKIPTTVLTNAGQHRAVWEHLEATEWSNSNGDHDVLPESAAGPTDVVVLIDEINRADLGRVFGELITLIEGDKRAGRHEERQAILPYSRRYLTVPAQVHVVATMNTADRSLTVFDYAMRRRFNFEHVAPDPGLCPSDYGGVDLGRFLQGINERLGVLLGRDLLVGHAALMEASLTEARECNGWSDDEDGRLRAVAAVVHGSVIPLLLDYFTDDWKKVEFVLDTPQILVSASPKDAGDVDEDDWLDLADRLYVAAPWSDPNGPNWDPDKLRTRLNGADAVVETVENPEK